MSDPDPVVRMASFARALRERGVRVGLADERDGLEAAVVIDGSDREELRRTLAIALKIQPRQRAAFEELFASFYGEGSDVPAAGRAPDVRFVDPRLEPSRARRAARATKMMPEVESAVLEGDEPGWSPDEQLRRKPFDAMSDAELAAMERLLARLVRRIATQPSRRLVPARSRGAVDLRRSLRGAVAQGGELFALARRARAIEEPRLVVLCDTSGSMDPHARFLLAFMLGLRAATRRARSTEIFAFNTALVRLTPWIRPGGVERTLARLAEGVPDWSGGTRIGECLARFAERYLPALVDRRTVVLVMSDGLDRGDVAPLAEALRAIRARARRLLWINPLAGDARYEPTARAMAVALPHLDRLLPAHNLESLERLLPHLAA